MLSDHQARQAALNPHQSYIVQAPAGSGKTALLVYRMLAALATVERPEQVLAITFTRKATAEMRERVLELLQVAESDTKSANPFEQQGIDLAKKVLLQDQQREWRLLDAPEQLQLHTIDAFCARLSGDMPWLSRLGDKPGITENPSGHYSNAIDALFANLLSDPNSNLSNALRAVLMELDFNYSRARRLFSAMLSKRDQWLRHLVQNDLTKLRSTLTAAWQDLVQEGESELRTQIPAETLNQLCHIANQAANHIPPGKRPLTAFISQPASNAEQLSAAHWHDLVHLLTTAKAKSFRTRVDKNLGFPTSEPDLKKAFQSVLKSLVGKEDLLLALQHLDALPNPNYSEQDWRLLLAQETVLLHLAALLQLEFRSSGECDHSEVSQRALRALSELDSPTDLALKIDYQLSHVLVDEFQDTSRSQLELLRQLVAGWQLDDGRSLFLVGDPMQSIYRFREADVSLYLQVTDNDHTRVFDNIHIEALKLSENFRSCDDLVSWFNDTFTASFPAHANVLKGSIAYAPSTSNKTGSTSIRAELAVTPEQEAERVVAHVKDFLRSADQQGRIAILVRSRNHLNEIIPALEQNEIPFTGLDIKPLVEVAAVQDIITLCKAIAHPHNRLAWLALLRSPVLGLSLAELQQLGADPWHALEQITFDPTTQARLQRFMPIMRTALAQRQQVPLHALTRWTWRALGGEQLQQGLSSSDLERIFTIIARNEHGGDLLSLTQFEQDFEDLYAQPDNTEISRVILSTVHKAKGLQYDTVILPGLDRKSPSDEKNVMMWAERNGDQGEAQLLLAPIRLAKEEGSHFDYLRRLEAERAQQERIRLMYVACTRAERGLILLARPKFNKDGDLVAPLSSSLLAAIWAQTENQFSLLQERESKEAEDQSTLQGLNRLPAKFRQNFPAAVNWQASERIAPQQTDQELEFEWATELATGVGLVLHSWLENHAEDLFNLEVDDEQRRRWREQLRTLRVPEDRLSMGVKRLQSAVEQMQNDNHAQFIFDRHREAHNEFAITSFVEGKLASFKIDRTFIDQHDTRWVVDYKTTTTKQADVAAFVDTQTNERHKPQLENYGRLMSQLDSRPIKLAVYFPMLGELRSWDFQT